MFDCNFDNLISEMLIPPYFCSPDNICSKSSNYSSLLLTIMEVPSFLISFEPGAAIFKLLLTEFGLLIDDSRPGYFYSCITFIPGGIFLSIKEAEFFIYFWFLSIYRLSADTFSLLSLGVFDTFIHETAIFSWLFYTLASCYITSGLFIDWLTGVCDPFSQEILFYFSATILFFTTDGTLPGYYWATPSLEAFTRYKAAC